MRPLLAKWCLCFSICYLGHSFPSKQQASFNFKSAVTVCSDSGAQENKICHCFHFFPFYLPWSDATGCHDLSFFKAEFQASFFTLFFHPHQEGLQFPSKEEWIKNLWYIYNEIFSSAQSLSRVQLFATPWRAARQASLFITNSRSSLKLMFVKLVMPSSHLMLCRPLLLLPQSLPASESFPMSQLFAWSGQSIGVSVLATFLPKNTQDWSPLEWTGWIFLQSKGLSRVFSNTKVQKHQFFPTTSKLHYNYNSTLPQHHL